MLCNHRSRKPPTDSAARWANLSNPEFDAGRVTRNLGLLFGVQDKPFLELIELFITALKSNISHLKPYQVLDYHASCKARYEELYRHISRILDYSSTRPMFLTRNKGKPFIKISSETEIHFQPTDESEEEVVLNLRLTGHPKLYGYLCKAIIRAMFCLEAESLGPETYSQALLPYLQIILSVGQLFDDIRGNRQVIDILEEKSYQDLQKPPVTLNRVLELWPVLLKDLEKGRKAPQYIRDIATVVQWSIKEKPKFNFDDYHISLRSTGTSKGGKALNGIAASVFETDPYHWSVDSIIDYQSYYRKEPDPDIKQYDRKTITIEQHKPKRRVIHMASNPIQDRCNWFHHRLEKILWRIESDCTFNQDAGREFAKLQTRKALNTGQNIYSADISDATGTISPEFQEMVVSLFLGPELARAWSELTRGTSIFCFSNHSEQPFTAQRGQFQGYKSSFPAFALAHHILMRLVMLDTNRTNLRPKEFYRVLGDDSIITVMDPRREVLDSYESLANDIGWEINHSKGCYFFADTHSLPIAEFAKVRYCNGEALSPLPLMLTIRLYDDDGLLPALLFIAKHLAHVSLLKLKRIMDIALIPLYQEFYLSYLVQNQLGPWKYIERDPDIPELTDDQKSCLIIHYFRTQLYRTILGLWLPSEYEKNLTEGWTLAKKNSMIFLEWLKVAEDSADLDSNHKIWYLMDKQARLIDLIQQVVNDASLSLAGLAVDVSENDNLIIESACEMVSCYKEIEPEVLQKTISKAIDILSRFNPRSDSRNVNQESSVDVGGRYAVDCIQDMGLDDEYVVKTMSDILQREETRLLLSSEEDDSSTVEIPFDSLVFDGVDDEELSSSPGDDGVDPLDLFT